jgi:hypothetical protein
LTLKLISVIQASDYTRLRNKELEDETFAESSILPEFKEGENFNHRNILDIPRIKICA